MNKPWYFNPTGTAVDIDTLSSGGLDVYTFDGRPRRVRYEDIYGLWLDHRALRYIARIRIDGECLTAYRRIGESRFEITEPQSHFEIDHPWRPA